MTGDRLVNPEMPPAGVVGALAMVVIVEPAKASLNKKSPPPPAPVSTNLFPFSSVTTKLTFAPFCVSATVPNTVPAGGHPVLIWQLVKLKVSALADGTPRKKTVISSVINPATYLGILLPLLSYGHVRKSMRTHTEGKYSTNVELTTRCP
jgi:hypothetical protein